MTDYQEFENPEELLKTKQRVRKLRKGTKKQSFLKSLLRLVTGFSIIFVMYYFSTLQGWYLPQDAFINVNSPCVQIVNNKIVKTPRIQGIL